MPSGLRGLRAIPVVPVSGAGRAALVVLALLAALHLAGSDGVRVGPWAIALLPGWALAAGAVLAAALLPADTEPVPVRALAVAGALVLALAGIAGMLEEGARGVEPRLDALLHRASAPDEAPRRVTLSSLRLRRKGAVLRQLSRAEDLRLELTATLEAPRSGTYTFILGADDAARLALDGVVVLNAAGAAAAEVPLSAGEHRLQLEYEQRRGPARLELTWRRPAALDVLPLEWFLRTDGTFPDRAAEAGRILRADLAALLAWTIGLAALLRAGEGRHHLRRRGVEGAQRLFRQGREPRVARSLALAVVAGSGLLLFESVSRPLCPDGMRFQPYSSEYLMQTVSAADLRLEPLRSLWYLHIQPPLLDALRAVLALSWPGAPGGPDASLVDWIDARLYLVFAGAYGALTGLVAAWLWRTTSARLAVAGAIGFAAHPAAVVYATVLDSTLLSAALFAWLVYELWAWRPGRAVGRLAAAVLLLFLTRSAFQWPFLLLLLLAVAVRGGRGRALARLALLTAVPIGLFLGKQWLLFGSPITSSFAADSFCKGLGAYCRGDTPVPLPRLPDPGAALVLRRLTKLNGEYNYNQLAFLRRSFSQRAEYLRMITSQPVSATARAFLVNAGIYLRPSSRYTTNVLAERMPWRGAYDLLLSGPRLVALLVAGVGVWWWRTPAGERGRGLALALPVLYVVAVTIAFERGENHRYKFFVEPVLWVFLVTQAHALVTQSNAAGAKAAPR